MTGTDEPETTHRRRATAVAVGTCTLLLAAVVPGWLSTGARSPAAAPSGQVPVGAAPVTRGTVTERVQIGGTLGFDGSNGVVHQGRPGTLTRAPDPGTSVSRGGVLYAVDDDPVRLLYGATPMYRDLVAGVTDGPDVEQLERNLVALGMDEGRPITVDRHFTAATAAALRRWQAACGVPTGQRTGALRKGQAAFLPGALRVAEVHAAVGAPVGGGTRVLSATSTRRVVTAQLSTDRQHLVHKDDPVVITLSGAPPFPGSVTRLGRVAAAPVADSEGRGEEPGRSTVPVTISARMPARAPEVDQAPVQVAITRETRDDVLLVPVTALLARPGGGYQVRLAGGGHVEVRPGLFDSSTGTVEVAGDLRSGQQVEVPAP